MMRSEEPKINCLFYFYHFMNLFTFMNYKLMMMWSCDLLIFINFFGLVLSLRELLMIINVIIGSFYEILCALYIYIYMRFIYLL